jgi:hypothetical protein
VISYNLAESVNVLRTDKNDKKKPVRGIELSTLQLSNLGEPQTDEKIHGLIKHQSQQDRRYT